jgi:hypothetical protein
MFVSPPHNPSLPFLPLPLPLPLSLPLPPTGSVARLDRDTFGAVILLYIGSSVATGLFSGIQVPATERERERERERDRERDRETERRRQRDREIREVDK